MNIKYEMSGLSELNSNVKRVHVGIIGALKKSAYAEAKEIMDESLQLVPRETNTLANSAFIEQDSEGNVDFGYGGEHAQINPKTGLSANDYMIAVHERLDLAHPEGQAKFLETPINNHKVKMEDSLVGRIKKLFNI